jgi:hypothetical protein
MSIWTHLTNSGSLTIGKDPFSNAIYPSYSEGKLHKLDILPFYITNLSKYEIERLFFKQKVDRLKHKIQDILKS